MECTQREVLGPLGILKVELSEIPKKLGAPDSG